MFPLAGKTENKQEPMAWGGVGQLRLLNPVASESGGIRQVDLTFADGFGAGQFIAPDVCGRGHSKTAIYSWKFLRWF